MKKTIFTIKMWIKSWYFDVENEIEYIFSRRIFFHWLKSLSGNVLTTIAVNKISLWITVNLDTYSTYSLNYHYIHVDRIDARTTSIAEAMHHSMKHAKDGGRTQSALFKSAEKMMDKAQV